jgi:hypothetical protein
MPAYCAFHFKDPFKSAPGILAVPPKSDCGEAAKFPYQAVGGARTPDISISLVIPVKKVKIFIFFNENKHIKLQACFGVEKGLRSAQKSLALQQSLCKNLFNADSIWHWKNSAATCF